MPFVETSFLSGLAGLAGAVGTAVQQFRQPTGVFPASFQVSPATPALFGLPTFPEARQFMGEAISGGNCIVPTIDCKGVARFPSEVIVPKQGGGLVVFKNMGKAILMSGDLAACKRVRRIQKRVARAAGKR